MNDLTIIDKVNQLEVELINAKQEPCPVYHHFSPGLYIREVSMPAGSIVIGHKQKTEHLNIFLKGRVSIVNDDGSISDLKAPMLFTGKPGRKCGYVHEDVTWLNVYPTSETDIEKLESMFIEKSENWLNSQPIKKPRYEDIEDFKNLLKEYGFTEDQVREQSVRNDDIITFENGSYRVCVSDSNIEGKGIFATADITEGEFIIPAMVGIKRTIAGRYANHAKDPNASIKIVNGDAYLIARKDISGCRGGILGDEITIDYRESLKINGVKPCQV